MGSDADGDDPGEDAGFVANSDGLEPDTANESDAPPRLHWALRGVFALAWILLVTVIVIALRS